MAYQLQFGDLGQYAGMFASGAAVTLGLTAVSTALASRSAYSEQRAKAASTRRFAP